MTRKSITKSVTVTLLSLLVLCLLPAPVAAGGLGVTPPALEIADALKGDEYQRQIRLFNTMEEATNLSLSTSGDISQWVTFYDPGDLTTPIESVAVPSKENTSVLVRFSIPGDAANGTYSGSLHAETGPLGEEGEQGIRLRTSVPVTISVTGTQVLRGTVNRIEARDTEIGLPLCIEVTFANTGNVAAQPDISVAITRDNETVAQFSHGETTVEVDSQQIIEIEWDTSGSQAGDYYAVVEVSLGGSSITTKKLPFKILDHGSLAGDGKLLSLDYEGQPATNTAVKIQATFQNTGAVETRAKLVAEVYRDGNLVDALQSEESVIPAGQQDILTSYFKPDQPGNYSVKGHVIYEGKKTGEKEISFTVAGDGGTEAGQPFNLVVPVVIGVIGLLIIVIIYILLRGRQQV